MRHKKASRNIKELLKPLFRIVILSFLPIDLWPKWFSDRVQSQESKVIWLQDEAMAKLWIQEQVKFGAQSHNLGNIIIYLMVFTWAAAFSTMLVPICNDCFIHVVSPTWYALKSEETYKSTDFNPLIYC